jgi:hypothetical protein
MSFKPFFLIPVRGILLSPPAEGVFSVLSE